MDNKELLNSVFKNKIPEIELDFRNNPNGEMIINVNFNKTLSNERKTKEYKYTPYSKNIILLFIDSVSRANSMRQLKKTLKFFEKFMFYKGAFNEKYPSEIFHSFQFFKYHSFKFHTSGNFPLLFYGRTKEENKTLITKYLKENGYITCYTSDLCIKDNIRTKHNMTKEEAYDHQFLICDPNKDHYNFNLIKCLYEKNNAEHLYDYNNKFWRIYENNRKYLLTVSNDAHEGTLEVLKYIDDIIYNFLINLFNDNLLKETTIFLISDHGVGMPSFYYLYNFYGIEENLPMLYMIINDRKNISYFKQYSHIYENQQIFITAYDIYNTISNIIFGDKYFYIKNKTKNKEYPKTGKGKSLFEQISIKNRKPDKYDNMSYVSCK